MAASSMNASGNGGSKKPNGFKEFIESLAAVKSDLKNMSTEELRELEELLKNVVLKAREELEKRMEQP
ncbi:unnamed protein product [Arabidopsis halleri]